MNRMRRYKYLLSFVPALAALAYCFNAGTFSLFSLDQKGIRQYRNNAPAEAAMLFVDPVWRAVALFKSGAFKEAAGYFAGQDTAIAAFNHGNSLVMMGKYNEAVARYDRALELKPGWEHPMVNRAIAMARAELLQQEGGNMTGGMLGADEIVFSEGSSSPSAEEEVVEMSTPMSDSEMQALWLRQVQTKPADFLRAKFSYQFAKSKAEGAKQP